MIHFMMLLMNEYLTNSGNNAFVLCIQCITSTTRKEFYITVSALTSTLRKVYSENNVLCTYLVSDDVYKHQEKCIVMWRLQNKEWSKICSAS